MLIGTIIIASCLALFVAMAVVATRREIENPFEQNPTQVVLTSTEVSKERYTVLIKEDTIIEARIETLKNRLRVQLDAEKYEDAAITRDEIETLENRLNQINDDKNKSRESAK